MSSADGRTAESLPGTIDMINALRQASGFGLKETKELLEKFLGALPGGHVGLANALGKSYFDKTALEIVSASGNPCSFLPVILRAAGRSAFLVIAGAHDEATCFRCRKGFRPVAVVEIVFAKDGFSGDPIALRERVCWQCLPKLQANLDMVVSLLTATE